jgi:regulatory protein|tara:strand:- start:891 stop:1361 length:471 start_codon:yes stop_codon:yes gene_type:complete
MKTGSKEKDLFLKLCRYCAYRERCISELRDKMKTLEISNDLQGKLIELLKKENFVLEKRFAESYARGKFRNNAWGIQKIKQGLKSKGIKQRDIDSGIQQIEQEEYQMLLKKLAHAKMKMLRQKNILIRRKKVADYLQRKGFEMHLVWEMLKEEFPD